MEELNKLNSYNDLHDFYSLLSVYCKNQNYTGWHLYGPVNEEEYKNTKPKILVINSESGGFEGSGPVSASAVINWIDYKTPRYSIVFASALIQYLNDRQYFDFDEYYYKKLYQNREILLKNLNTISYANTRFTSNTTGRHEETIEVDAEVDEFAIYRNKLISIINPDFIIASGKHAKRAISLYLEKYDNDISYESVMKVNNKIIIFSKHLSNPRDFGGYYTMHEKIVQAINIM